MRQIPESSPSSDNSSSPGREAVSVATISVVNDFPEDLYEALRRFVSAHPSWDQYRVMQVAVAGFLFQQGSRERAVARHYLDGLFDRAAAAEGPAPQLQGPALAGVLPPVAQEGPGRPAVSPSQGEGHGPHPAPSPCLAPASAGLLRRQGAPLPPHRLR